MGDMDSSRIQALVERPGENLSVELKRWIDPASPEGIAKIVKTALALRNHGGGDLVIGFDNDTCEPDTNNVPQNVREDFHIDKVQALISKYASEPFEVSVEFLEREGQLYPVIIIPPGVKTPVAAKSDLQSSDGKALISVNDVYTRSLHSNNTPSTTKAIWKDWPSILEVCFDNREADIGRFLRRHLGGLTPEIVRELSGALASGLQPEVTTEDRLRKYLEESKERYSTVIEEWGVQLPPHGAWEVGLLLTGDIPPHSPSQEFLNLLNSSNPRHTFWPVWLDSSNFHNDFSRPYVFERTWETLIQLDLDQISNLTHPDFMRLDPKGRFYLRRPFNDDIRAHSSEPMASLNSVLPVVSTAEAIAVGIAFAKAMGCDPEKTQIAFGFRWTRLQGRQLDSWIEPRHHISPGGSAHQDEVTAFVEMPLETPLSALGEFVNQAVKPLFEVFDGFALSKDVVEDLTRKVIEKRL